MTERDLKILKSWERKHKMGKWKYIAVYGGVFMLLMLIFRNGSDYFSDKLSSDLFTINSILKQLVSTAIGGFIYGLITWFMNEGNYEELIKRQANESNS